LAEQWVIPEGWETISPGELATDGENPNRMNKKKKDALLLSLQTDGWLKPIVVDMDNLLVDGEQKWDLANEDGQKLVPIRRIDVDDGQRRILRQVLNRLEGEDDEEILSLNYKKIDAVGLRQTLIRRLVVGERALREALEGPKLDEPEYRIPALESVETDIELGDMFQLGDHMLICGDATKKEYMERLIGDTKVDCVFTDPPYGVYIADWDNALRNRKGTETGSIYDDNVGEYEVFTISWLSLIPEYLSDYNSIYIWINGANIRGVLNASVKLKIRLDHPIIWVKNAAVLSRLDYLQQHEICLYGWKNKHKFYGKAQKNVWRFNKPSKSRLHPTMKPIDLCAKGITNSTMPGMVVLDVFGGSGSTMIACEQTGRRCFMMELDPRYCQIIIDRWEAYSGGKAKAL